MGLFRRREPLHERLAREGGLTGGPLPEPARPGWLETGIHGVHRAREWDAVVTVEAEGVAGGRARFVVLADDSLVIEEGDGVDPIADALEGTVPPPFRAEAVRRGESQWAVGLRRIVVVELDEDPGGDELTLTVRDGERTLLVDGVQTFGTVGALEELGAARAESYVVECRRLVDSVWEATVTPL